MRQHVRAPFDEALRGARVRAFPAGEFVGQESFMQASEILALARRVGIGPGVWVLDLCCGVAGPGRLITSESGCRYGGVDSSAGAVELARARAAGLACRFEVARVPPVPSGPFDVVLLLETMLAFADKGTLIRGVATALVPGGSFAFTVEEGEPLTDAERAVMPDADTVWPAPMPGLLADLEGAGLEVTSVEDHSGSHRETAERLLEAFTEDRSVIAAAIGDRAVDELLAAHRLWARWLGSGRVRKLAIVAERPSNDRGR